MATKYAVVKPKPKAHVMCACSKQICDAMHCRKPAKWREAWDDDLPFPTNYWCGKHKPTVEHL